MKQVATIIQALFTGGAVASALFLDNVLWVIISILIAAGAGYYAYFYNKENNEIPIWKSLSDNTKDIISMIFSPLVLGLVLLLAEIFCVYKMMEFHSPSYSWGIAMLICGIASAVFLYNYNSDKKRKLVNEILKYTGCVITTYCLVLCLVTWNGRHKYNYNKEVNNVQNDSYSNSQSYNNSNQNNSQHSNQSYSINNQIDETTRMLNRFAGKYEAKWIDAEIVGLWNYQDLILNKDGTGSICMESANSLTNERSKRFCFTIASTEYRDGNLYFYVPELNKEIKITLRGNRLYDLEGHEFKSKY